MRSFYVYVRTTDNQFLSCNVSADNEQALPLAAYRKFAAIGNPLPLNPAMIVSMRFVADPRNEMERIGEPVDDVPRGDPDSYAVYSEYTHGDPTH